jgi:hypothetical protein
MTMRLEVNKLTIFLRKKMENFQTTLKFVAMMEEMGNFERKLEL